MQADGIQPSVRWSASHYIARPKLENWASQFKRMVLLFLLLFCCALLGTAIVFLPFGVSMRGALLLLGLLSIGLAWGLRSNTAKTPSAIVLWFLLATVGLSILWPRYVLFPAGSVYVNPQTLSVLGSIGLGSILLVMNPQLGHRVRATGLGLGNIGWLIALWFGWRLLAAVLGDYPIISTLALFREIAYSASFLLVAALILSYENADRWLLRVIVMCGLIAVAFGLVEAFLQRNPLLRFASGGDSDAASEAIKSLVIEKIRGGQYRAQSVFTHPIVFAQVVSALLPLGLLLGIIERKSIFWRVIGWLVIPVALLAILKSGSRAGLVSLIGAVGFGMFVIWLRGIFSRGYMRMVAVVGFPILLISMVVGAWFGKDLVLGRTAVEAGSTGARTEMLRLGMNALERHPFVGYGEGMAVGLAGLTDSAGHTSIDSYLLSVAVDSGYIGLLIFLAVIMVYIVKSAMLCARLPRDEGLKVGLVAAAVMALFIAFIGLSISHNMTLLWVLMMIGLHQMLRSTQQPSQSSKRVAHRL